MRRVPARRRRSNRTASGEDRQPVPNRAPGFVKRVSRIPGVLIDIEHDLFRSGRVAQYAGREAVQQIRRLIVELRQGFGILQPDPSEARAMPLFPI